MNAYRNFKYQSDVPTAEEMKQYCSLQEQEARRVAALAGFALIKTGGTFALAEPSLTKLTAREVIDLCDAKIAADTPKRSAA